MRRWLLAAVVLAGCSRGGRPNQPTPHEASAAQDLTEDAFEQAEKAKISASKALDQANLAQKDLADAQHDLAKANADAAGAKTEDDRAKAQQKVDAAQQKLAEKHAAAQEKTQAALQAQAEARTADARYQALSRKVHVTLVAPRAPSKGDGAQVLPGTVGPLETTEGKVAAVGNDRVVITTPNQTLTLQTDDLTQVNVNGRLVGLRQLPAGLEARVAYTPGSIPVARRIDATSLRARPKF